MTDLAKFLLARIAEDEACARNAFGDHNDAKPEWTEIWSGAVDLGDGEDLLITNDSQVSRHIERWDPARVLAECEAKRRIVEWHQSWPVLVETPPRFENAPGDVTGMTYRLTQQIAWATQEEYRKRFGSEPPTAPILRLLALPYADHPDYREEWRP